VVGEAVVLFELDFGFGEGVGDGEVVGLLECVDEEFVGGLYVFVVKDEEDVIGECEGYYCDEE
jgi:hypothetical protein